MIISFTSFVKNKKLKSLILSLKAADKDFWCKRPEHLQVESNLTSINAWRAISNSSENCQIYDYDWTSVSLQQIHVSMVVVDSLGVESWGDSYIEVEG